MNRISAQTKSTKKWSAFMSKKLFGKTALVSGGGAAPTPGYDLLGLTKDQMQGFEDVQLANIPLGRVGTADEIAKVVLFLPSDDSSFVNGIELFAYGGMAQI
jgi:NAD(P)-dependent dehydrogenase (short-subunit alcohol dehydrogenase family)